MKFRPVWMMPVVALLLVASGGGVWADTSDVKGAAPVIVGKALASTARTIRTASTVSFRNQARRPCKS